MVMIDIHHDHQGDDRGRAVGDRDCGLVVDGDKHRDVSLGD